MNDLTCDQCLALQQEITHLRHAIEARDLIGQAKGLIMAGTDSDADEAFRILVAQSQHENRKLRDVAEDVVADHQRRHHLTAAAGSGT